MKLCYKNYCIHYTTLLFLAYLIFIDNFIYGVYIYISIIVHEIGHIIFIKYFKRQLYKVELYPIGGIISYKDVHNDFIVKELLINSGGILFNTLLIIVNCITFNNEFIHIFNILMIIVNILPIRPLDGAKILENMLSLLMPYKYSMTSVSILSFILIFCISIINFNKYNSIYLFFIILLLFLHNITFYMSLSERFNYFILNKYLNFNKRLKVKEVDITDYGLKKFYKGKSNFYKTDVVYEEQKILKYYLNL